MSRSPSARSAAPRTVRLAPSLLSADFARLADEVREIEALGAEILHVDVMDGHFVPNLTVGPLVVKALRPHTRLIIDTHLMMARPDDFLGAFADAGSDWITVHVEAAVHLHRTLGRIRDLGCLPGVALNPATPPDVLREVLPDLGLVLVMSVNPGFGGQRFIPGALDKVARVRAAVDGAIPEPTGRALVAVDGGVTADNARALALAGADVLVAGQALLGEKDRASAFLRLRSQIDLDTVRAADGA